jgi:hypothetical protein
MTFENVAQDFVAILEAWVASEMLRGDEERQMVRGREREQESGREMEMAREDPLVPRRDLLVHKRDLLEEERASGSSAEALVERERERGRECVMCAAGAGGEAGAGGTVGRGRNDVTQREREIVGEFVDDSLALRGEGGGGRGRGYGGTGKGDGEGGGGGGGGGRGELVKYHVLEIARAEEKKMGWFHTAVKCQGMYTHTNTLSAKVCTHTHTKCQGMYTHTHTHTQ